jgi:hypothetical protein
VTASSASAEAKLCFISDEPSAEDRFGAHTAIVDAIISAIAAQSNIRLIGLLGRWGTGKSTIVSQLSKTLCERHKDEYVVFTYDVWAHQGDPPRRSILEELIERLIALNLTKEKMWHEMLSAISGSTESSSTTTTTRLSAWGKVSFVLLLLLPLFLAFTDGDTLRLIFDDDPNGVSRALVIGLMVYGILLGGTLFAAYLSSMQFGMLKDKKTPLHKRVGAFLSSGEDLLSIVLTRNFPANASTTLRKSQPTAIEFRRYLREVVESQKPRRLVFVIDNLDRIDPEEALNLWSIMVGMVADEAHRMDAAIAPIVILPFDPVALERIVPSGKLEGHSASDLIEKSFDVTFEVPPPVLSNWRSYFAEQYERCGLSKATNDSIFEQYWTVHSFEARLGNSRVTPRKINRFLNRVISLSEQQIEKFQPSVISYYIAHEAEIQSDCIAFLKGNRPGFDSTNAWQRKIAAIAFGTTEAKAAQVVLGDELFDALTQRDLSAFESIANVAGFTEVISKFIEAPPTDDKGGIDSAPLTALAAFYAKAAREVSDPVLWWRLWQVWKNAVAPTPDNFAAAALIGFIEAVPTLLRDERAFLVTKIVEQLRGAVDPKAVEELIKLGNRIVEASGDELNVNLGRQPDLLLKIVGASAPESRFAAMLRCQCSFEDLAQVIIERLQGKVPILAADSFYLVDRQIKDDQVTGERNSFYPVVAGGLNDALSDVESSDQTIIAAALLLCARNGAELRFEPTISQLEDAGTLSQAVARATENDASAVVSALAALRITAKTIPQDAIDSLANWLGNAKNAGQLIGSILQANGGSFLTVLRDLEVAGRNVDPILQPVLVAAVKQENLGKLAPTDWLLKIFPKVSGWLSVDGLSTYARLVSRRNNFAAQLSKLADTEFLTFVSKLSTSEARELLAERVRSFEAPRLAAMIVNADGIWHAFNRLGPDIGQSHSPKSELFKALHNVLSGRAGDLGSRTATRALKLVPYLSAAAKPQLIKSVVTAATDEREADAIVILASIDGFKPYISRPSVAADIIARLFMELRRSRDGQTFIERNANAIREISEPSRSEIRAALIKALSYRDERSASWARFVLDKSGLDR